MGPTGIEANWLYPEDFQMTEGPRDGPHARDVVARVEFVKTGWLLIKYIFNHNICLLDSNFILVYV